jgi:hypothetical protein
MYSIMTWSPHPIHTTAHLSSKVMSFRRTEQSVCAADTCAQHSHTPALCSVRDAQTARCEQQTAHRLPLSTRRACTRTLSSTHAHHRSERAGECEAACCMLGIRPLTPSHLNTHLNARMVGEHDGACADTRASERECWQARSAKQPALRATRAGE